MLPRLIVALLCLGISARASAQCEVTGVASIERLRVGVPASERMRLFAVTDLPIAVVPGSGGTFRTVRVLAPLAFEARTDAEVPWTVPRSGELADGMLWLTPLVDIEDVLEERGELVMRAQLDEGVWVSRVRTPCGTIALGHGDGESVRRAPWGIPRGPRWQPIDDRLWITSEPGEGAGARLDAPEGLPVPLVEVERRGDWVRVAAQFASGAALRGWARRTELRAAPRAATEPRAFVRSAPMPPSGGCARRVAGEQIGPAQIAPGTEVHTRAGGPAWATIAEHALVTVAWSRGSPWARIVHVPGLRGQGECPDVLARAWVRRESVTFRGDARTADPGVLLGVE